MGVVGTMSCSAVFILDAKGKIIINRNYRGDIPMTVAEKFSQYISETEEEDLRPVVVDNGIIYVYVKYNNLYLLSVTKRNANAAVMLLFLYPLCMSSRITSRS